MQRLQAKAIQDYVGQTKMQDDNENSETALKASRSLVTFARWCSLFAKIKMQMRLVHLGDFRFANLVSFIAMCTHGTDACMGGTAH